MTFELHIFPKIVFKNMTPSPSKRNKKPDTPLIYFALPASQFY